MNFRWMSFFLIGLFLTVYAHAQHKLLLLGDSITLGQESADWKGFRSRLYTALGNIGFPRDFVGSSGSAPYEGFFQYGAEIAWFLPSPVGSGNMDVTSEMNTYRPNLILIHLGTNDMGSVQSAPPLIPYSSNNGQTLNTGTKSGLLAYLISYLLKWKDGTKGDFLETIFVSKIIPRADYSVYSSRIESYNDEIQEFYEDSEAGLIPSIPPGSLRIVDHHTPFNTSTMIYSDGIHPNDTGYQKMADVYFNALKTLPLYMSSSAPDTILGVKNYSTADPVQVQIVNGYSEVQSGVPVQFQVIQGDAVIDGESLIETGENGIAKAVIQLNTSDVIRIRATASNLIEDTHDFYIHAINGFTVSGHFSYYNTSSPIPDVNVTWKQHTNIQTVSNSQGNYELTSLLPNSEITLELQKDAWSDVAPWMILSYDASMIAQYVVGLRRFDDVSLAAADANQDGIVNMYDASQIARSVAGLPLPQNVKVGSWIFTPDSLNYNDLWENLEDQDAKGFVLGDVHTVWTLDGASKHNDNYSIEIQDSDETDSLYVIVCKISGSDISAFDVHLSYDLNVLEFIQADQNLTTDPFQITSHPGKDDNLRVGGFRVYPLEEDEAEIRLAFKKKANLDPAVTMNPVYLNDRQMESVTLNQSVNYPVIAEDISLFSNFPNPFNSETIIQFVLENDVHVQLTVHNELGQVVVKLYDGMLEKGLQKLGWNGRDAYGSHVASGIYLYKLKTVNRQWVGKMQLIQ